MIDFPINHPYFKLKEEDIKQPFEDLRHVQPHKAEDVDYGIDLFLFLNYLMYLPNTSFDLDGKDENSKKIKKVIVDINKGLPFVREKAMVSDGIRLSFRVIPRTSIQDPKLQINPDRILISKYSRFLVVPEKFKIRSFVENSWEANKDLLHEYLAYAADIITNRTIYPYFGYVEKEEKIQGKIHELKILKLIFNQKELVWRE